MLSLIVLDIQTFLVLFPLGCFFALALAWMNGIPLEGFEISGVSFQVIYLMIFSSVVAVFFSRNREQIEQEKIETLRAFGATIAHEMRTPLSTIALLCKLIKRSKGEAEKTLDSVNKISREVSEALLTVDMMLTRLKRHSNYFNREGQLLSMKNCVLEAIDRYPFGDDERESVEFNQENDFSFIGKKESVIHILFNLIQNSLYQIHASGRGHISISMKNYKTCNVLSVKDNATGIDPALVDKLFSPMISNKFFGTGLGLSFCKNAMEAMGGVIRCDSVFGEYADFVLEFPSVTATKIDKIKALMNISSR